MVFYVAGVGVFDRRQMHINPLLLYLLVHLVKFHVEIGLLLLSVLFDQSLLLCDSLQDPVVLVQLFLQLVNLILKPALHYFGRAIGLVN